MDVAGGIVKSTREWGDGGASMARRRSRKGDRAIMKARDLDFEAMRPINVRSEGSDPGALNPGSLDPGSRATPFSTFIWAIASGDIATAEAQITDDVEWGLMRYNKVLKGKNEVIPWLRAGSSSKKEPITISNVATKD